MNTKRRARIRAARPGLLWLCNTQHLNMLLVVELLLVESAVVVKFRAAEMRPRRAPPRPPTVAPSSVPWEQPNPEQSRAFAQPERPRTSSSGTRRRLSQQGQGMLAAALAAQAAGQLPCPEQSASRDSPAGFLGSARAPAVPTSVHDVPTKSAVPGWESVVDATTQEPYWFNRTTGEVSWQPPPLPPPPLPPPPPPPQSPAVAVAASPGGSANDDSRSAGRSASHSASRSAGRSASRSASHSASRSASAATAVAVPRISPDDDPAYLQKTRAAQFNEKQGRFKRLQQKLRTARHGQERKLAAKAEADIRRARKEDDIAYVAEQVEVEAAQRRSAEDAGRQQRRLSLELQQRVLAEQRAATTAGQHAARQEAEWVEERVRVEAELANELHEQRRAESRASIEHRRGEQLRERARREEEHVAAKEKERLDHRLATADRENARAQFADMIGDVLVNWVDGGSNDICHELYAAWCDAMRYPDPSVPRALPQGANTRVKLEAWSKQVQRAIGTSKRTSCFGQ